MSANKIFLSVVIALLSSIFHVQSLILQSSGLNSSKSSRLSIVPQQIQEVSHNIVQSRQFDEPFWDDSTKYASNFIIQGKKVTKKTVYNQQFYQITSLRPLPKISTTVFRLLNNGDKDYSVFSFGIMTQSRKQNQFITGSMHQFIYLNNLEYKQGKITGEGKTKWNWDDTLFVEEGGLLSMEVNMETLTITFVNRRNKSKRQFPIPQHYRQQNTYISVVMRYKDDAVEIEDIFE